MITRLLHKLDLPKDIKSLTPEQRLIVCQDIRDVIQDVLPKTGGHLASNMGVVELTLALHIACDFPKDKLVFDVGHQAYPHKLLTGRLDRFHTLRQKGGLSGFPHPQESIYDTVITGHAGTAISTALGMSIAEDIKGTDGKVVAVVGDGSICGLAFEGLNHCGALKQNLIVVLNDNKMAISPTVGAFSRYLSRLRSNESYQFVMEEIKALVNTVPVIGESLDNMGKHILHTLQANLLEGQFFHELGFRYFGPVDGHDLDEMVQMIHNVREIKGPVLLHVLTRKGKGSLLAEADPYTHYAVPKPAKAGTRKSKGWSQCFVEAIDRAAQKNDRVFAITAAMVQGTKLQNFIDHHPDCCLDTGIAEGHAVTLAGGLQANGVKPVVLIYSSFLQRSYDNIFHDICLQQDGFALFGIDRAGLVGDDGPSHHGVFDIAYLRHLPRMILMAPKDELELDAMVQWALSQGQPVAIRYPRGGVPELKLADGYQMPAIQAGKPELISRGKSVALVGYGAMVEHCMNAAELLEKEAGIHPSVINLRFVKPIDTDLLAAMLKDYELVVTVEDHALMGGMGSALLEVCQENKCFDGRIVRIGIPDRFIEYADREELLQELGMDGAGICARVIKEVGALSGANVP